MASAQTRWLALGGVDVGVGRAGQRRQIKRGQRIAYTRQM